MSIVVVRFNINRTVHHRRIISHDDSEPAGSSIEPKAISVVCDASTFGRALARSAVEHAYAHDPAFMIASEAVLCDVEMIVQNPIRRLNY